MNVDILSSIRKGETGTIALGLHHAIIQSILDFDADAGRMSPSVLAIVTGVRKAQKFHFGDREILIPCVPDIKSIPKETERDVRWMLNVQSGRRAFASTIEFFEHFPRALGGTIFAENVPEKHATELIRRFSGKKLITGPASVGILVPGHLKLGAIGGVDPFQMHASHIGTPGNIAVFSTSGGMTNEFIHAVVHAGRRVSFAAALGGDRFPVASVTDVFRMAEADPQTDAVVYFGELGGVDEYEIVELIRAKGFTKPLVAYIGGIIDEAFDDHVQFGHAKALVAHQNESARAKRESLREVGAIAPDTFDIFLAELQKLPRGDYTGKADTHQKPMNRQKSILSTRKMTDTGRIPLLVKGGKLAKREGSVFTRAALGALLERPVKSNVTVAFADAVFELLIDHGGHVSGAVNTMITARAGKDMVSSLAAGLLTIGPRFGGALNASAAAWLSGVSSEMSARAFVEAYGKQGERIPGIGHRKYRVGLADPRVKALSSFATLLKKHPHCDFARSVEKLTTGKNGNLILNIDGVIAALLLDILTVCEGYSDAELKELVDAEFFNALFVIPRTVGFLAHFIEQKRNDEGLFRLPDELLFVRETTTKRRKQK